MKLFNIFKVLKTRGLAYTILTSKNELKKMYYMFLTELLYRGKDKTFYGQYAEDLVIDRLLGYKSTGYYVDIGANHPTNLSNTKKFYDGGGWKGINVDPNPECFELLNKQRPRDLNLNVGVGRKREEMEFYDFKETEISTFSKERANKLQSEGFTLKGIIKVKLVPLDDILKQAVCPIDFLSVDAEDQNFEVLKSNDWSLYKPKLICIENDTDHDYTGYLKQFGYKKGFTNLLNTFFILK